jgi:hypothetical protein
MAAGAPSKSAGAGKSPSSFTIGAQGKTGEAGMTAAAARIGAVRRGFED